MDQSLHGERRILNHVLEHSGDQPSHTTGFTPVVAKGKLIEIGLKMLGGDCTVVGAEPAALEMGDGPVAALQRIGLTPLWRALHRHRVGTYPPDCGRCSWPSRHWSAPPARRCTAPQSSAGWAHRCWMHAPGAPGRRAQRRPPSLFPGASPPRLGVRPAQSPHRFVPSQKAACVSDRSWLSAAYATSSKPSRRSPAPSRVAGPPPRCRSDARTPRETKAATVCGSSP